jgi:polysaccharide deacetylase 2 family uncharacterized protein YibQ
MELYEKLMSRRQFLITIVAACATSSLVPFRALAAKKGRLVTIFDDAGDNKEDKKHLEELAGNGTPYVVALMVGGHRIDEVCHHVKESPDKNRQCILHQPFESLGGNKIEQHVRTEKYDSVKHRWKSFGIYSKDNPHDVMRILEDSICYVNSRLGDEKIIAVNNHMGSEAMMNPNTVGAVAQVLAKHSLFFIDSGSYKSYPERGLNLEKHYERTRKIMAHHDVEALCRDHWLDTKKAFKKALLDTVVNERAIVGIGHLSQGHAVKLYGEYVNVGVYSRL